MTDIADDDDGPLSIDEAVDLMSPEEPLKADENPDAPRAETDEPADAPAEGEEPEDEAGADPEAEEEETVEDDTDDAEDAPPAPASWSKEDQAVWAKLDPAARAVVAKREADRDRATKDATQRAGQASAELKRISEAYEEYAPVFADGFQSRWGKVDWVEMAGKLKPEQYNALRAEMEEERQALADFKVKQQEASQTAYRAFLQEEAPKLKELAPEIAEAGEPRIKLVSFLREQGFEPERIAHASAAELAMAYDAMRYRQARANAKAKASEPKKQPAAPAPKAVKAAPAGTAKSQDAEIGKLRQRVVQTRSIDDALDFLDAKAKRASRKR